MNTCLHSLLKNLLVRLTVGWLIRDARSVVQNPVRHVEIGLHVRPQLTFLNLFTQIPHEQEKATEEYRETVMTENAEGTGQQCMDGSVVYGWFNAERRESDMEA